jgi:hypothetical protein
LLARNTKTDGSAVAGGAAVFADAREQPLDSLHVAAAPVDAPAVRADPEALVVTTGQRLEAVLDPGTL